MRILAVTRGVMGSGKSTWIKQNGLLPYSIDPDDIRTMIQNPVLKPNGQLCITQKNDRKVWELLFEMLENRMRRGDFTIVGATHQKPSDFSKYKQLVDKYRYRFYTIDFSDVPLETCLERNRTRDKYKFVPEEVIENSYARIQNLKPPNYANITHRDRFLDQIHIRPLDYNEYDNIYVTSDIHGSWSVFRDLLDKINWGRNEKDLLIVAGDLFDRGKQTKEVLKFWVENHNKSNFIHLDSNHHQHFHNYAFGDMDQVRASEFIYRTIPQIEDAKKEYGYDNGLLRNLCRKTIQMVHFSHGDKIFLVTHGGISSIPDGKLEFVSSIEMSHGVGKYEELEDVCDSWIKSTPENYIQIFGHRNIDDLPINYKDRCYLLDGHCEKGGELRCVKISKDGVESFALQNTYVPKAVQVEPPVNTDSGNDEWVAELRKSKDVWERREYHISSFNFKRHVFQSRKWKHLSMIARSLFINNATNEIICRSYLKFFNYQEREKNTNAFLRQNLKFPVMVYEKYNGFLFSVGYDRQYDSLVFCSKSTSEGIFSKLGKNIFYANHGDQIEDIKRYLAENNMCMIFEAIDPVNDPHIIKYEKPQLILLDVFSRQFEPKKLDYDNLLKVAHQFGLQPKDLHREIDDYGDLIAFLEKQDIDDNLTTFLGKIEGYVIEDSDGYMFKVKTAFYKYYKMMRGMQQGLSKGRQPRLGQVMRAELNEFLAFMQTKSREELGKLSIIDLMGEFFATCHH